MNAYTKRNTILCATGWTTHLGIPVDPNMTSITDEDIEGLMEVIPGLMGDNLDLILHSPGGWAEATEAFLSYLRMKFINIRVIIPYAAMSAAPMLSCAANSIVMGKHSFIGPIDPQIVLQTQSGNQIVSAAQAILDQFKLAKTECQDPTNFNVLYPILGSYGPALIQQYKRCYRSIQNFSIKLVKGLLEKMILKIFPKILPTIYRIIPNLRPMQDI